ncbi:Hypothetical predicted protein [Lecanosticta acicola]|uniref:Uncharacterized protein n=1 Tax=Lecanosticta acicola TaxID=111012 RepID=A0AAI9E850_9PEZI|nr:Hypothetical predicted protein [Lecanosticta acicola]
MTQGTTKPRHPGFDSKFYAVQDFYGLRAASLTNAIHPLFRRSNFQSSLFDYEKLETTLRLASNLLEVALPVFHCIFFSPPVPFADEGEGRDSGFFPRPLDVLTTRQVKRTRAALAEFTGNILFGIADIEGCHANCEYYDSPDKQIRGCKYLKGYRSQINIGQPLYEQVLAAWEHPNDILGHHWHSFQLAVTLVHEVTHAGVAAGTPEVFQYDGFILGDCSRSEPGLALEEWLFGGTFSASPSNRPRYRLDGIPSKLDSLIAYTEGPDPAALTAYQHAGDKIYVRPGSLPEVVVKWTADLEFISNLFQDAFWNEETRKPRRKALRPRMTIGVRMSLDLGQKCFVPFPPIGVVDNVTAMPEGYSLDECGMLYATQPGSQSILQAAETTTSPRPARSTSNRLGRWFKRARQVPLTPPRRRMKA